MEQTKITPADAVPFAQPTDLAFTRVQTALIKKVERQINNIALGKVKNPALAVDPSDLARLEAYALTAIGPDTLNLIEKVLLKAYTAGWDSFADLSGADLPPSARLAVKRLAYDAQERIINNVISTLPGATSAALQTTTSLAALDVVNGKLSVNDAREVALRHLNRAGITAFRDRAGRSWSIERYTKVVIHSQAMSAYIGGAVDRMTANGITNVRVNDSTNECRLCRPWENRTLTLDTSGASPHPTLDDARAAGLFHPGCRHSLSPIVNDAAIANARAVSTGTQPTANTTPSVAPTPTSAPAPVFRDFSSSPTSVLNKVDLGPAAADRSLIEDVAFYQFNEKSINRPLRRGDALSEANSRRVASIDTMIESSGGLPEDTFLWRGFQPSASMPGLEAGAVISDPAYLSTSVVRAGAEKFAEDGGWVMRIEAPKGTKGLPMTNITGATEYRSEYEFLLPRGARLEVLMVSESAKKVTARIVND